MGPIPSSHPGRSDRMKPPIPFTLLAVILLSTACEDSTLVGPDPEFRKETAQTAPPTVVMTRNLYVGANLDVVIAALLSPDPGDDLPALLAAIDNVGKTDFGTRAQALAEEIASSKPLAVGLQEVSTIEIPTVDGPLVQDFWAILEAALQARGLSYDRVATIVNVDLFVPPVGARLVDQDMLLVHRGARVVSSASGNYAADLPLGFTTIRRGWVSADVWVAGKTLKILSTHLESGPGIPGLIRAGQATELTGMLAGVTGPVIVMGDLNDEPGSATDEILTANGFIDAWAAVHPGNPGLTCCHAPDLANTRSAFTQRLDYVFVRGGYTTGSGKLIGGARVDLVGDEPGDKVAGPSYPIWPSDHAGVVIKLPPAR
ncbi:MAG: hypothetical protein E4G90_02545 [Gemmatimonadales bacterium]|nr:MAG: hypothetical protein E4G90_02545 [Gemmatimonadales bacterium]